MAHKRLTARQLRSLIESVMNENLTGQQRDRIRHAMHEEMMMLVGAMLDAVETVSGRQLKGDEQKKVGEAMEKKMWTAVEMAVSVHAGKPQQ